MEKASAAPQPYTCNLAEGQAASPEWVTCRLCNDERASDLLPFAICARCALLISDHVRNGLTGHVEYGHTEMFRRDAERDTARRAAACVYYVRRRDRIKIGTTTDFAARMAALQPDEILAVEPGDRALESARQRQFVALRVTGEWFRDDPVLREHIATLRRQHGAPPVAPVF